MSENNNSDGSNNSSGNGNSRRNGNVDHAISCNSMLGAAVSQKALHQWFDGEVLSGKERDQIAAHVSGCAACGSTVAIWQAFGEGIRQGLSDMVTTGDEAAAIAAICAQVTAGQQESAERAVDLHVPQGPILTALWGLKWESLQKSVAAWFHVRWAKPLTGLGFAAAMGALAAPVVITFIGEPSSTPKEIRQAGQFASLKQQVRDAAHLRHQDNLPHNLQNQNTLPNRGRTLGTINHADIGADNTQRAIFVETLEFKADTTAAVFYTQDEETTIIWWELVDD